MQLVQEIQGQGNVPAAPLLQRPRAMTVRQVFPYVAVIGACDSVERVDSLPSVDSFAAGNGTSTVGTLFAVATHP